MSERERFESWARQRWTHPEDFDQRIKDPGKYNNYEVQAAWDAWQERAAQPAPSVPDGWLRAIDEALVVAHICVANESDTYEQAKAKLDTLIGLHVDIATDPAVNGGWKLVPVEILDRFPEINQNNYNHDDVCNLNAWGVELVLAAAPKPEAKP